MSDRIDSISNLTYRPSTDQSETGLQDTTGTWQGETVEVGPRDALSLLDDAKEEITTLVSEEMEIKDIKERKVEEPDHTYSERVNEIEGAWKMLEEQLPDLDLNALHDLFEEFMEAGDLSEEEIQRRVSEKFPDPSHAFMAMQGLDDALRINGREEMAERVGTVRERFMSENGPSIRAGLNVSKTAMEISGGDRAAAQELRDLYRSTIFGTPGPSSVYRGIIDQYGMDGFGERLRFLTKAVGDDLSSEGPSIDRARLQELIRDLSTLRVLDTVHERCGQLTDRLERQNHVKVEPTNVMQALLPLTEEPVNGPSKIIAIPEKLGIPQTQIEARITLFREAREVMGMLPVAIYRDMDARGSVLRAMQEAMDIAIEQEEAT